MSRITEGEARGLLDAYRSIYEGYGEKKEKTEKKKVKHDCATHGEHAEWGVGSMIKEMHTLDEEGNITHYDVMFEHGIEKNVPVEDLVILEGGMHEHYVNDEKNAEVLDEAPQVVPASAKVNQQTTTPKKGESAADARTRADAIEYTRRGGFVGQAARTLTRGFGSNKDIAKVDAADKASQARINQRVAASQGKYYSSSDQKTYRNYNDAVAARNSRLGVNKDKGTGTGDSGSGGTTPPPNAKTAPTGGTVLAKQQGVTGTLDKATGKFTAKNWSDTETQRYQAKAAQNAPRPGTKAAGPESIKPKTANPLMKDMPGQNKSELDQMRGNAALQSISQSPRAKQILSGTAKSSAANEIGKASLNRSAAALEAPAPSAKTTPTSSSGSALGSAANPAVRQQLNLPIKAATPTQATAAAPSTSAPASGDLSKTTADIAKKTTQPPVAPTAMKEGVDAYDLVLDYLLENGHADTVDEAHYVMLEMDSKMIKSIVEGGINFSVPSRIDDFNNRRDELKNRYKQDVGPRIPGPGGGGQYGEPSAPKATGVRLARGTSSSNRGKESKNQA